MSVAIVISQPGGPEVLKAIERVLNEPGPDEVQIQHEVIGVNFVDIYYRSGRYLQSSYPVVPGFEGGGRVTAVGHKVGAFSPGDRVAYTDDANLYKQGAEDLITALQNGLENPVGAEYALTDAAKAHTDLEAGRTTGSVILTV